MEVWMGGEDGSGDGSMDRGMDGALDEMATLPYHPLL